MIKAQNLTKFYGSQAAIRDVSFQVGKGEVLGFLGPNGAGKTTTMRILSAYMPPSGGQVSVDGYDVFDDSLEVRKRIGYLPESVPLYRDMTVSSYLDFVATLRRVSNRDKRIRTILDKVGLTEQSHTRIDKLSKGMRQRVGIAQAIIHEPQVLILDEPTIGLDPKQIVKIRELIRKLGQEHTIILSTHILSEVEQICNRILIINKGVIIAEDDPTHLSKRLQGNQQLRLEVRHAPSSAIDSLLQIPGIEKVRMTASNSFDIESTCQTDCRSEIADLVVQHGWGLLELHTVDLSLEDVFIALTKETHSL